MESVAVNVIGLKKAGTCNKTGFNDYEYLEGYSYNPEGKDIPLYIANFTEIVESKSQP